MSHAAVDAYALLVRQHHASCLRFASRMLHDDADAEDAVQDENERITGSAIASLGGDWLRQNALPVTLPNGTTFSGMALSPSTGAIISFFRSGSDLPVGTYAVGVTAGDPAFLKGGFSGGYAARRTDGLRLFLADSGKVTIAETGTGWPERSRCTSRVTTCSRFPRRRTPASR